MNDLTRRLELSVNPTQVDPWDVLDLGGWDAFMRYERLRCGLPWREAAVQALVSR